MRGENQNLSMAAAVEAILFKLNEPTSVKKLAQIVGEKEDGVVQALSELKESLKGRGVDLLQSGDEYSLVTARGAAGIIERMVKDEMGREIGKAGLETLSIILYRGPLSRREIDYIRGVNSTFILRSLMTRGLVERIDSPAGGNSRSPQYKATSQLLAHLGISKISELPEFDAINKEINELPNENL